MMENHISVRPRSPVLEAAGEWRQIVKAQLAIIHYYNRNLVMSTQLTLKLILQDSSNTCSKLKSPLCRSQWRTQIAFKFIC